MRVSFVKLSLFAFYPSDIDRTIYIIRWQVHHHHQLGFFSTPTPIKDSVGDDGGEEACAAGRAANGAALFNLL